MGINYEQLRGMEDRQLWEYANSRARQQDSFLFFRDELVRRENDRHTRLMLDYTAQMTRLTWFVAVFTVVNVLAVLWDVYRRAAAGG